MLGSVIARLSLQQNAHAGRLFAITSAVAWAVLIAEIRGPSATQPTSTADLPFAGAAVIALVSGYYSRGIALRDLESRTDVTSGAGTRWRWVLAARDFGAWLYWLVADHTLPARSSDIDPQLPRDEGSHVLPGQKRPRDSSRKTERSGT